jgi:Fe2+ transport system protein FeoA
MEESEIQNFIHSGGKMANIERLSQDMQSNNPKKRLDACERRLFSLGIPDKAIEALRKATKNSDPDVAEMARKALDTQLHVMQPRYRLKRI